MKQMNKFNTTDGTTRWPNAILIPGRVTASPIVEGPTTTYPNNTVYIHSEAGSLMKFGDNGGTATLLWVSKSNIKTTGGYAALGSNNRVYVPFRFEFSTTFRAGAFNKSTGLLIDYVTLPGEDIAKRSIGNSNYVYFGTLNKLISIK